MMMTTVAVDGVSACPRHFQGSVLCPLRRQVATPDLTHHLPCLHETPFHHQHHPGYLLVALLLCLLPVRVLSR